MDFLGDKNYLEKYISIKKTQKLFSVIHIMKKSITCNFALLHAIFHVVALMNSWEKNFSIFFHS